MSTDLRRSVLARFAALIIALSLPVALAACAGSTLSDDSYFLGANHAVPAAVVGIAIPG